MNECWSPNLPTHKALRRRERGRRGEETKEGEGETGGRREGESIKEQDEIHREKKEVY